MKVAQGEWAKIEQLSGEALKQRVFGLLKEAALAIHAAGQDDPNILEMVPRLAELIPKRPELTSFGEAFSSLARATGLWNYIDKSKADISDVILAEAVTVPELGGVTLHREQIAALNDLLEGRNLILSAPTSFGKSLLVDALLASGKYNRVAIVLPTIALLDEFRRRLRRRFAEHFEVIMHPSETAATGERVIFLGTQERLINREDLGRLDLTVVDEFYKLDPERRDDRSVTLNAAVFKLLSRSKQFFFLGPNIDGVHFSADGRWKFDFLKTRFSTVAVDTYDLKGVKDKQERLLEEIAADNNWPALVFVSSPDKVNRLSSFAASQMAVSDSGTEFSKWLAENVGSGWALVETVKYGFGIHHGRIPRAIASHMVRLFNNSDLPVLFCTSTLIEGVNTAAKTVLIYDKEINRSDYDFFTFSNIKGRAGRLGEHHVGRVFLFNSPPDAQTKDVSPTLFADEDDAPDDYVVHLDEVDTTKKVDSRVAALKIALNLDAAGLRLAASIGLDNALALKEHVAKALADGQPLGWAGYPGYGQIQAVLEVICKIKRASDFGAFTPKALTYFINTLRLTRSMKDFLRNYDQRYQGKAEAHDNIFKFLRACEYGLPQWFAVVEVFVKQQLPRADYSVFLQGLSRWFKAEELKNLDEEGIPIQISERFHNGEDRKGLTQKLARLAITKSGSLTPFERKWILAALEIDSRGQPAS
ncbi:MAG TPA: DEAD/DEAH box helicase [Ramlibacter sp.]|jgi:hypothetical protein|uniref:DEAD/DEAH box helicase n=1 Tax=Ramlibacter sp. TaxID=1917967 RepID=UPI002D31F14D|nr:DEAD/DEAH box helicase [Ramlibacter sp.]HZY18241.1 DEAD/DEAH box helicase [Ramlibacter sp.]